MLEAAIVFAVLAVVAAVFIPLSIHLTHKTRIEAVEGQLTSMSRKARTYIVDMGLRRTTYDVLVKEKVFPAAESILGESYDHLVFEHVGGTVSVHTKDGERIIVRY